jgi:hypothetical protein
LEKPERRSLFGLAITTDGISTLPAPQEILLLSEHYENSST